MDPLIVRAKENTHKLLLATTLILIAVVGFLGYSLWGAGNVKKVQAPSPEPTSSSAIVPDKDLETCTVKIQGNPLVADVRTLPSGTIVGNYRGNINKIEGSSDGGKVNVEVVSPKGEQTHTFTVKEEDGLVYDATARKDLTLADLASGQSVTISFDCVEKDGIRNFRITRIAVTGRL